MVVLITGGWGHCKSENHVDSCDSHIDHRAEWVILWNKYRYKKLGVGPWDSRKHFNLIVFEMLLFFNLQKQIVGYMKHVHNITCEGAKELVTFIVVKKHAQQNVTAQYWCVPPASGTCLKYPSPSHSL